MKFYRYRLIGFADLDDFYLVQFCPVIFVPRVVHVCVK